MGHSTTKPRTQLSDLRPLMLLGCVLLALPFLPTPRFQEGSQVWRFTEYGWELAHALPSPVQDGTVLSFTPRTVPSYELSDLIRFHRCLLPVAIASLFGTLLPWLVLSLPNHAVNSDRQTMA